MLLYHHCRNLDSVVYGKVKANPKYSDPDFRKAYFWLKKQVGFYPLFLAFGSEESLHMTGYNDQWRRGESRNHVLFSFENADGTFMDFDTWHIALNASNNNYHVTEYEKRLMFKPSWTRSRWLRKAEQRPDTVQLVTPELYLPDAKRIWVRNKETKRKSESIGFGNVEVRRLFFGRY